MLNKNLVESWCKFFFTLERLQELTSLVNGLRRLADNVSLDEGLKLQFLQNEGTEVMVGLDHVLEEGHNSETKLQVKLLVKDDSCDRLVKHVEEPWTQQARSVVAGWDKFVAKQMLVVNTVSLSSNRFGNCGFLALDSGIGKDPQRLVRLCVCLVAPKSNGNSCNLLELQIRISDSDE